MKLFLVVLVLLGPILVSAWFDRWSTRMSAFDRAQIKIAALEKYAECMSRKTQNTPDTVCKQIWANRFVKLRVLHLSLELQHRSHNFRRHRYSTSTSEAPDSEEDLEFERTTLVVNSRDMFNPEVYRAEVNDPPPATIACPRNQKFEARKKMCINVAKKDSPADP